MQRLLAITSDLRLFVQRYLSFWTVASAVVLAIALIIRILVAFPVHKYQADADGIVTGLCALNVLKGDRPVFYPGGYRLGAQSCYVTAVAFSVFGTSRASLMLTGLLFTSLFAVFMYLYLREAFGPRLSLMGLPLAAVPPQQLVINTYAPWAYGEILMYCASTLWLATLLKRQRPQLIWFFALGASAGLALWCSVQSFMITLPVILWLSLGRVLNSKLRIMLVAAGMLAGSSPVWIFLARGGAAKILGDGLVHASSSSAQVISNASYLVSTELPWLLVDTPASNLAAAAGPGIAITLYVVAALSLLGLAVWPNSGLRKRPVLSAQAALLGLIAVFCVCIYVFSAAGSVRGPAVRYLLPLYLVVPGIASILCATSTSALRVVTATGVVFLVTLNARMYPSTISPLGKSLRSQLIADERWVQWLEQNQIQAVLGDYWDVYGLNFDSNGIVTGIPLDEHADYLQFASKLARKRLRWAIVEKTPRLLAEWRYRLNLPGNISPTATGRFLFVPNSNPPGGDAGSFLLLARESHPAEEDFASAETNGTRPTQSWVKNVFKTILLREPTGQEVSEWTEALDRGARSQVDFIEHLLTSVEFEHRCLPQFWAYLDVGGGWPSRAEWLTSGPPQPAIGPAANLATKHKANDRNRMMVYMLYFALLGRDPDPPGLASWSDALDRGALLRTVITGFLESPEYSRRGYQ